MDGLGGRLLSGCYELELQGLDVTLHRSAGVQQLGGTLLALPFVRAPRANVRWASTHCPLQQSHVEA